MSFADRLTALRTQRSLSQEDLAAELGVSRQTIGKWENGQASPEMSGLITLSNYFCISIDALVKDGVCQSATSSAVANSDLSAFLLRAKRATYAGHAAESAPTRPAAHEFVYAEADLTYRDRYFGGTVFHGEETVWAGDRAIWCMNYSGRTLSDVFSGDFLKLALQNGTLENPYRGPAHFACNGYAYTCRAQGNLDWFDGDEAIFFGDQLIYECRFHGGTAR